MKKYFIFIASLLISYTSFSQKVIIDKLYSKESIPKFILFEPIELKSNDGNTLLKEHLKLKSYESFSIINGFIDEIGNGFNTTKVVMLNL